MRKLDKQSSHIDDVTLWAWLREELDTAAANAVQEHVAACSECALRTDQVTQMLTTMRIGHHAVQPTLAQQTHLLRALANQTVSEENRSVWVKTSERLLRWLTPAVALLVILFSLNGEPDTPMTGDILVEFLIDTPEAAILVAATEEEMQNAMLELMLDSDLWQ
jgi:anti-sigma factor RsiW